MGEQPEQQTGTDATDRTGQINRRGLLKTVGVAVVAGTGVTAGSTPSAGSRRSSIDTTLTLDNVGSGAWEVTDIEGDDADAPLGEDNPTIELAAGARFEIENEGWSPHPLAFRDPDGEELLSQADEGTFEDDPAVDWQDDGDTVAFTLTDDLADELAEYFCTVHSAMAGDIVTATTDVSVSFSDETGNTGEEVAVSFDIDPADDPDAEVGSYDVEISYDDAILSFVDADGEELPDPAGGETDPGTVALNAAQATGEGVPLTAATLFFDVEDDAEDGAVAAIELVDDESEFNDPIDPVTFESEPGSVTVETADTEFLLSNLDPEEATVVEGEGPIDVSVDVTNDGSEAGDATPELTVTDDDTGDVVFSDSVTVPVAPGDTETVTFEDVPTETLPVGEYTHAVASQDDSTEGSLTVAVAETEFLLSNLDPEEATVFEGQGPIEVAADVTNDGTDAGEGDVELTVTDEAGGVVYDDTVTLTVGVGETEPVTFEDVPTQDLPVGEYEHTVSSDDDSLEGSLTVEDEVDPIEFRVGDVDADGEIDVVDAVLIQQHLAGLNPSPFVAELADVTRDGGIGVVDAVLIQQFVAGLRGDPQVEVNNITVDGTTVTATLANTGGLGTLDEAQLWIAEQDSEEATLLAGYRAGDAVRPDQLTSSIRVAVYDIAPDGGEDEVEFDISDLEPGSYLGLVFTGDDGDTFSFTVN